MLGIHKIYLFLITIFVLHLYGCDSTTTKIINVKDIPLLEEKFKVIPIDSTHLLHPTNLYCYKNHILIFDGGNNPAFTFWSQDSLQYEFSAGYIGAGPNEFINPRGDYFASSDSSFFILDSNIEWEVQLEGDSLHIIDKTPIVIPDAINQMVHLDDGKYIMASFTDGSSDGEHFLYDKETGNYTPFGDYPTSIDDVRKVAFDFKFTAGKEGKECIWDFYQYHNLIRQYDVNGTLMQELTLGNIREHHNSIYKIQEMANHTFWRLAIATEQYIYTLFYEDATTDMVYFKGAIPELQIWDWNGNLKKRVKFDYSYNKMTISKFGILYAINDIEPFNYLVYTYNLQEINDNTSLFFY